MGEHTTGGTKQRVSDCRKRLRRERVMQRALKVKQAEARIASGKHPAKASAGADSAAPEDVFEEAGASTSGKTRRFTPEVDRRARLRAR